MMLFCLSLNPLRPPFWPKSWETKRAGSGQSLPSFSCRSFVPQACENILKLRGCAKIHTNSCRLAKYPGLGFNYQKRRAQRSHCPACLVDWVGSALGWSSMPLKRFSSCTLPTDVKATQWASKSGWETLWLQHLVDGGCFLPKAHTGSWSSDASMAIWLQRIWLVPLLQNANWQPNPHMFESFP